MYTASVVLMGQSVVHISQQLRNCQKKPLLLQDADRRCWCMPLLAHWAALTQISPTTAVHYLAVHFRHGPQTGWKCCQ